jgi:hypothetical protein
VSPFPAVQDSRILVVRTFAEPFDDVKILDTVDK